MRKFYSYLFPLALAATLFSCLNERNIELARPATFVRYINSGKNEVAKALAETPDKGYIILANSESEGIFKIKLIKTDSFGNIEWTRFFPESDTTTVSMRGNGISLTDEGGYIIAGEDIHNDTTKLFILVTDGNLEPIDTATLSPPSAAGYSLSGLAVASNGIGKFIVLGNISGSPVDNMIVTEVDASLNILWDKSYGRGPSTLVNKIFIDENQKAVWTGTVTNDFNRTDIRFIRTPQNSEGTDFENLFGEPDYDETVSDLCRFGTSYALVGSTNEVTGTGRDILFKRITDNGELLTSRTYPLTYSGGTDTQQVEEGNALAPTADGGFIILGTIVSTTSGEGETIGRGEKDYYLIKVNGFGEVEWTRAFGSKRDDVGVSVLQAVDGGYVMLGTTRLANVETIALIKTNRNGEVE